MFDIEDIYRLLETGFITESQTLLLQNLRISRQKFVTEPQNFKTEICRNLTKSVLSIDDCNREIWCRIDTWSIRFNETIYFGNSTVLTRSVSPYFRDYEELVDVNTNNFGEDDINNLRWGIIKYLESLVQE